jgi:hypothetical protein
MPPLTMSAVMNLFTPWLALAAIVWVLIFVQRWVFRHLFGLGWLITKRRNVAVYLYGLAVLPGVLLREGVRYFVAGLFKKPPVFIMPQPQVGDDGIVEFVFLHYMLINPVYRALIGVAPLLSGLLVVALVGEWIGLPSVMAALNDPTPNAFREATLAMLGNPAFPIGFYLLFGVANLMLPTRTELRDTWIFWLVLIFIFALLAVLGLHQAIFLLLRGPISQVVYTLVSVCGVVLAVNLLAAMLIWAAEKLTEQATNRRVEYQPTLAPARAARASVSAPTRILNARLPVPGLPGRALPAGVKLAALPAGESAGDALPALPERQQPLAPIPARASGTNLPAPVPMPSASTPLSDPLSRPAPVPVVPAPALRPASAPLPNKPLTAPATPAKPAEPPATAAPKPFAPAAPATPVAPKPFAPAASNLPAVANKAEPPPTTPPVRAAPVGVSPFNKPGAPATSDRPYVGKDDADSPRIARPTPKPSGIFGKPAEARSPNYRDDDVIDADVIEDDVIDADIIEAEVIEEKAPPKPAFNPFASKSPASSPPQSPFASKPPAGQPPPSPFGNAPRPAPKPSQTMPQDKRSDSNADSADGDKLKYEPSDSS